MYPLASSFVPYDGEHLIVIAESDVIPTSRPRTEQKNRRLPFFLENKKWVVYSRVTPRFHLVRILPLCGRPLRRDPVLFCDLCDYSDSCQYSHDQGKIFPPTLKKDGREQTLSKINFNVNKHVWQLLRLTSSISKIFLYI
jgi:hypothetical protein